jgi:hypothetical protein
VALDGLELCWRDGTFGCRWDDPQSRYRVLYASERRLGAYLEALAVFRPDPRVLAGCADIEENDVGAPLTESPGFVPAQWRADRILGTGLTDGVHTPLVVIGGAASLALLRSELAWLALECEIADLDAAAIRLGAPRRFTQGVSRLIYEQVQPNGSPYAGIRYLSIYGDDVANCAIFERGGPMPISSLERSDIEEDDDDFLYACALLGIRKSTAQR